MTLLMHTFNFSSPRSSDFQHFRAVCTSFTFVILVIQSLTFSHDSLCRDGAALHCKPVRVSIDLNAVKSVGQ